MFGQRPLHNSRRKCPLRYRAIQSEAVEVFLNFVWVVLSLSLVAGWVFGAHPPTRRDSREWWSEWGRQAVALGILLVILLPVVSLTDDLQAWTAPAEVAHELRRADSTLAIAVASQVSVPWFPALLTAFVPAAHPSGQLAIDSDSCKPQMGVLHPLENRPPPVCL